MSTSISNPTSGSGITQSQAQQAFEDALAAVNADDVITTRHHDCTVLAIPASASAAAEIQVDNVTAGTALVAAVKKIHASATFGAAIEIRTGANEAAATRKFIMNLGEGPLVIECAIPSGDKLFVRNLANAAVSSGVLTLNLLG
jgi:hypothetical protein